jgi:hypothetical protein
VGDPGYDVPAYSALRVDLSGVGPLGTLAATDRIDLRGTTAAGDFDADQIDVVVMGEAPPSPLVTSMLDASTDALTVRIENQAIVSQSGGDWTLATNVKVGRALLDPLPTYANGTIFDSITGMAESDSAPPIVHPRNVGDIDVAAPVLVDFDAIGDGCIDKDAADVPVGTVQLAGPAPVDTVVTVTVDDAGTASIAGGGTTVPTGSSSNTVAATGLAVGNTTMRASLSGTELTLPLEVADPCP